MYLLYSSSAHNQISEEFPPEWENILKDFLPHYHVLNNELKERLLKRIQLFLAHTPISGYQTDINDTHRLMVAASAVIMTLSFEKWNFNYLDGVLLVDGAVNKGNDISQGLVAGLVQTRGLNANMVLSKSALTQGFKNIADKKNVGVHEFAHVLDHADGDIDGIPKSIMPQDCLEQWSTLIYRKINEIKKRKSDINPYGATNEAEFFAVVCEYFFEKPHQLKKKHPELYTILAKTFQQEKSSLFKDYYRKLKTKVKREIGRNSPCPCGSGKKFKKCCLK